MRVLLCFHGSMIFKVPKTQLHVNMKLFFCGKKKMVVGCELVGERREEEIL